MQTVKKKPVQMKADVPLVVQERPQWSPAAVFYAGRDWTDPPPPHSIWKRKKKLFCIEGINSRHLVVARN